MGTDPGQDTDDLRLFHTGEHPCGYWPNRIARDLVLDPRDPKLAARYPMALAWGFRRSGDIVYRPHCGYCRACVPVRIPVASFRPDRSQRRCRARNAAVEMRVCPADRTEEQLALYRRYLTARHAGGGMDEHGALEFEQFLIGTWSHARFLEFREGGRLLAVAVTPCRRCTRSTNRTCARAPRHAGDPPPARVGRRDGPRARLPGLLDPDASEDGLQAPVPPARGLRRPALAHAAGRLKRLALRSSAARTG